MFKMEEFIKTENIEEDKIYNDGLINEKSRKIKFERYSITQHQIDEILDNELKNYIFPVKPVYNPRIRANGITKGEFYKWGQLKQITAIEIGKQDSPNKKFLIDTILHEYLEAEIMINQFTDSFYEKLGKMSDKDRHKWINSQIEKFFKKNGG
jgi:hypothetical protein